MKVYEKINMFLFQFNWCKSFFTCKWSIQNFYQPGKSIVKGGVRNFMIIEHCQNRLFLLTCHAPSSFVTGYVWWQSKSC